MSNHHLNQPIENYGCEMSEAARVVILVHGRGQTPQYMKENIVDHLSLGDVAYFAPTATDNTWYPMGFMASFEENEP
jgi:phospholipase/carboxylesterase